MCSGGRGGVCVEGCAPDVCMAACEDSALACWETDAGD